MTILEIKGKEYPLRLEYKELKKFETVFNGRSFMEIINVIGKNPSLTDLETLVYGAIQDENLSREQFGDLLDDALSDPDSGLTFEILMNKFMQAVESSVFISGMQTQQEKEQQKLELKKQGAI